jgi:hypothetical protein
MEGHRLSLKTGDAMALPDIAGTYPLVLIPTFAVPSSIILQPCRCANCDG